MLLAYCYAGTIPIIIPSAYFLSGVGLVAIFVVLSEAHFNDRFQDHYLTSFQVAGHVALQLCFLAGRTAKSDLSSSAWCF